MATTLPGAKRRCSTRWSPAGFVGDFWPLTIATASSGDRWNPSIGGVAAGYMTSVIASRDGTHVIVIAANGEPPCVDVCGS